jgi:hypothetical protein
MVKNLQHYRLRTYLEVYAYIANLAILITFSGEFPVYFKGQCHEKDAVCSMILQNHFP